MSKKYGIRTGDVLKDKTIHDLEDYIDKATHSQLIVGDDLFKAIDSTLENLSYFALSLEKLKSSLISAMKNEKLKEAT